MAPAELELSGVQSPGTRYAVTNGRLLHAQGRPQLAMANLLDVPIQDQNNAKVPLLREHLYLQALRPRKRRKFLNGSIKRVRLTNDIHLLAGLIHYQMHQGRRWQARQNWQLLQTMDPGAPLYPLAVPVVRTPKPG